MQHKCVLCNHGWKLNGEKGLYHASLLASQQTGTLIVVQIYPSRWVWSIGNKYFILSGHGLFPHFPSLPLLSAKLTKGRERHEKVQNLSSASYHPDDNVVITYAASDPNLSRPWWIKKSRGDVSSIEKDYSAPVSQLSHIRLAIR